jgi:hypothetical protein
LFNQNEERKKGMGKNRNKKMEYIHPWVEVKNVKLEGCIATSPIDHVELKDWEYDDDLNNPENNADLWINL